MKCFELLDDDCILGLPVAAQGFPRVNITSSGEMSWPLIPTSAEHFRQLVDPLKPLVRVGEVLLTGDGLAPTRRHDRKALMRIDVRAGEGGLVTLTSGSYEDYLDEKDDRVEKLFHRFPCKGVNVVTAPHPVDGVDVWDDNVTRIELLIVLTHGACFRVHRTGKLNGLLRDRFVEWDAFHGMKLRPAVTRWTEGMKEEKTTQRRETLLPAVALA